MKAFFSDSHAGIAVPAPADAVVALARLPAAQGGVDAWFDLGVALSTGSQGRACDLVEAHKWFNIAASTGHVQSAQFRADLAQDMTTREVAEAQRRARQWLGTRRDPSRHAA